MNEYDNYLYQNPEQYRYMSEEECNHASRMGCIILFYDIIAFIAVLAVAAILA